MNDKLQTQLKQLAAHDESAQIFGAECRMPSDSMVIKQYPHLLPVPQARTFYRMEYAFCVRGREQYEADIAAIQQRITA